MGQCPNYALTPYKCFENWNYCHTHGGNVDNRHTSRMCTKLGSAHNLNPTRTNMMNGWSVGLHRTISPLASNRVPHVPRQQHAPAPASWQQPPPPIDFINMMAQMMPIMPYQQIHYMRQQYELTPPPVTQPAPPASAPPAGTMIVPYYVPYPQPHPF
jgi:hypothetical protein